MAWGIKKPPMGIAFPVRRPLFLFYLKLIIKLLLSIINLTN